MKTFAASLLAVLLSVSGAGAQTLSPAAPAPQGVLTTPQLSPPPRVPLPPVGSTPAERTPATPSRPLNTYSVPNNIALWGILFGGLTVPEAKSLDATTVVANCEQAVADGRLPPGIDCAQLSSQAIKDMP